jgi:hypothetical protein
MMIGRRGPGWPHTVRNTAAVPPLTELGGGRIGLGVLRALPRGLHYPRVDSYWWMHDKNSHTPSRSVMSMLALTNHYKTPGDALMSIQGPLS